MKKIAIIYGELNAGIQKKAIEVLSEFLLDYTYAYPSCFQYDKTVDYSEYRCIYVGTKLNNPYIANHSQTVLTKNEEYHICVKNDTVMIEGYDDAGVLYGCVDFYNKYILELYNEAVFGGGMLCEHSMSIKFLENELRDFEYSSSPSVKNRGIWTWGHVIYNYKGFIDNMVKLKMNTIIIWNDFVPVNAKEMIEYAHDCGIKIIWGYAWGWGTNCAELSLEHINNTSEDIFHKFEKEYAPLGVDGIYFQSVTEVNTERIEGVLVADAITNFVNKTSKLFFDKYPNMELQFGLHATSVKNRLEFIKKVDPRIRIVWENCGSFPFSDSPKDVATFAQTKAFMEGIAALRGEDELFGVVTKGLTKLNWSTFEHLDGSAFIGTSSDFMKQDRVVRKSKIWKFVQAYWLVNADKVLEMIKTITECKKGDLYITALVEDGMFEENLMYPVALYSEMLWDCNADLSKMMSEVAIRDYVTFA